MIAFCPTCANLLQIEKIGLQHHYVCKSCPYIYHIKKRLVKEVALKKKEVDDVLGGEEAWKNVQKTQVTCPNCSNHEAYFREIQTRSADEPATIFYRCTSCAKTWKEG
ncbi:hypothetical protein Ndes2526B_g06712 [Nannochloris sp. 'desiccata']